MRSTIQVLAVTLLLSLPLKAQSNAEKQRAQEVLAKVRAALGGEANLKTIHSLSLVGAHRRFVPGKEVKGEIKVDWLAPDKFLKSEKSNPQPTLTLTLLQAVNGNQVWIDRQISKPSRQDESYVPVGGSQTNTPGQIANSTIGMRDTVAGTTSTRSNTPGSAPSERSMLGMRIPTATNGQERDSSLEKMDELYRAAKHQPPKNNQPPGLEDAEIKAAMERQLRKDFLCLSLVWSQSFPATFPLEFTHSGIIKADHGNVEAIEITGPEGFAARLFIDQGSSLPTMISYPELMNRKAGYVVSNAPALTAEKEEIAVQLFFSDYRPVNGVRFPFLIIKAINGVPIDEWKIEKYKLNPDLKPKKFEKK